MTAKWNGKLTVVKRLSFISIIKMKKSLLAAATLALVKVTFGELEKRTVFFFYVEIDGFLGCSRERAFEKWFGGKKLELFFFF